MAAADVKEQILLAAGPIFANQGFDGATVREICSAASVNLAAVNYYFGDKSRLYLESVRLAYRRRSADVPMPNWAPTDAAEQKLRGFVLTMVRRMVILDDAPWETRLLFREVLQPTEACGPLIESHFGPQLELLMSILRELLPAEIRPHRVRQLAFSVLGQCLFYRVAGDIVSRVVPAKEMDAFFRVEQLADHIADVSLLVLKHCPDSWVHSSPENEAHDQLNQISQQ